MKPPRVRSGQDSKKPAAIRTNHIVGFGESCMLGRKFYHQRFWGKYSFGALKTARTLGEGLATSSSDTLRKCSYDSPQFVMCPMLARDFEGAQKHAYVVCNNRDEV